MAEIAGRGQKKKRLQIGGKTVFTADKEELDREYKVQKPPRIQRSRREIYKRRPRINAALK